ARTWRPSHPSMPAAPGSASPPVTARRISRDALVKSCSVDVPSIVIVLPDPRASGAGVAAVASGVTTIAGRAVATAASRAIRAAGASSGRFLVFMRAPVVGWMDHPTPGQAACLVETRCDIDRWSGEQNPERWRGPFDGTAWQATLPGCQEVRERAGWR